MSLPKLCAIVAMDENGLIGQQNQLPWRLPADLKHFKAITTGYPIIMGRKTYESIGRPLPNRTNIVVTSDAAYSAPGCLVATTIEEAIATAAKEQPEKIFVIGGSEIYRQTLDQIQCLYMTIVHHAFEGDVFFKGFRQEEWVEVAREIFQADEMNAWDYSFIEWSRK
ncbi:MAG: dihydrofolate reductase [Gammaproteobacteria bacterium]